MFFFGIVVPHFLTNSNIGLIKAIFCLNYNYSGLSDNLAKTNELCVISSILWCKQNINKLDREAYAESKTMSNEDVINMVSFIITVWDMHLIWLHLYSFNIVISILTLKSNRRKCTRGCAKTCVFMIWKWKYASNWDEHGCRLENKMSSCF